MHAQWQQVSLSQVPFPPQPTRLRVLKAKSISHPKFTHAHPLCPSTLHSQQLSCSLQFPHQGVERDFCHALTTEAFAGFNNILHFHSFYLGVLHNRTFLHLQKSTKICVFHLVYSDQCAGNSVFYGSVSTLLSSGVGYLQEGATT